MLKKSLKRLIIFLPLAFIASLFIRYLYLSFTFDSIDTPISPELVTQKMGQPDGIGVNPHTHETYWLYFQTPIPREFFFVIENNVVIRKDYSTSP